MKTSLVIFDLDGTLLDTIGDLAVACNAVLGVRGLPQHTYEEYCHFVGNGILRLVERALPEPLRTPETVAAVRADFVKYYTEHIDAHTRPYDSIPHRRRGVALAAVLGQRPGVPLKPSPAVVEEILARTGTAREEVLYVGDSGVDIETAAAAGVRSAGVTWGFRDRAELIAAGARHLVDRPGELLELL